MTRNTVQGSFLIVFLYDVCDSIHLDELQKIMGASPPGRKPPFRQPTPEYVQFSKPPVLAMLPPMGVKDAENIAGRIAFYEYGVISIQLEIAFDASWEDLVALSARWMNSAELEQKADSSVREHLIKASPAIVNGYKEQLSEDYYIIHLRELRDASGSTVSARDLIEQRAGHIAQIVRGESAKFSVAEQAEILESRMSYYETDLLVVGWSAALVYDTPEGAAPTIQLLEYANTQLLEFRHYDAVLTALLSDVYRSLERRGGFWARWRLARDAERLNTIRLDIRELTEHVDNSIKFLSDMFAARLYRMAAVKIGVPDYRTLVDQKLQSAGELYGFMMDRFYHGRAFVLEVMVVVILVIELLFLFRGIK